MLLNRTLIKDEDGESYVLCILPQFKKLTTTKQLIAPVEYLLCTECFPCAVSEFIQTSVMPTSPLSFYPCLTLGFSQRRPRVRMCGRWFCCSEKEKKSNEFFSFSFLRTKKIKRTVSRPEHSQIFFFFFFFALTAPNSSCL